MISKLGGLSTFEALSCRVPIIADGTTQPMPQEASTVNLIVKSGAAVLLQRASDVVPVVQRMIKDSKHYAAMRAATISVAIPNATKRIVEEITALIPVPPNGEENLPAQDQLVESVLA
jgi:UDP-N-acetylglucosamine:LPS N-acetylglucosamine transferase